MVDNILLLVILFTSYSGVPAGEFCYEYSDDWFDRDVKQIWCEHGCCGQYCCLESKLHETALIVGVVVGSITLVAIIVLIVVIVFCFCRKSRGQAGQVFQPSGTNVSMQTVGYGQVGYNGAVHSTVLTSKMTPGSVQTWQQPPPSYDQMNKV